MKTLLKKALQGMAIVPALALSFGLAVPVGVSAQGTCDPNNLSVTSGAECARGTDQQGNLFAPDGLFRTITNVLLFLVGAVAVIMLIIGGIRYVISGGDQNAVTSAKNTILYAIVGIIVALLAYGIVNFVLTQFAGQG